MIEDPFGDREFTLGVELGEFGIRGCLHPCAPEAGNFFNGSGGLGCPAQRSEVGAGSKAQEFQFTALFVVWASGSSSNYGPIGQNGAHAGNVADVVACIVHAQEANWEAYGGKYILHHVEVFRPRSYHNRSYNPPLTQPGASTAGGCIITRQMILVGASKIWIGSNMIADSKDPRSVFSEIGTVEWSDTLDAFVVETRFGARFLLYSFDAETVVHGVHIDEIEVTAESRRRGSGTLAMSALCKLADKHQFRIAGGPIGFPESPWRNKFVAWVLGFGFEADPELEGMTDSPTIFYVHRAPKLR